jgi:hypothetical protein
MSICHCHEFCDYHDFYDCRRCSPCSKVRANHFKKFINDKLTNCQWYFYSWPHPNVLSMTDFQTVNAILFRDYIQFLTNQIQNMLITAFNCHKKPMFQNVLFKHTRYTWTYISKSRIKKIVWPELVLCLIQISITRYAWPYIRCLKRCINVIIKFRNFCRKYKRNEGTKFYLIFPTKCYSPVTWLAVIRTSVPHSDSLLPISPIRGPSFWINYELTKQCIIPGMVLGGTSRNEKLAFFFQE